MFKYLIRLLFTKNCLLCQFNYEFNYKIVVFEQKKMSTVNVLIS
jgi:hypothetical protein